MPAITHVIFDLDGLLLDTESINERLNRAIAARYGREFDPAVKAEIAGRDALTSAQILVETLDLPLDAEAFRQLRRELVARWQPQAAPMPGAVELSTHFHRCNIPQAIATSSSRGPFAWKSAPHRDWFACFACAVLGDDPAVARAKPAPDLFLTAADRLGADPARCLVFEDSPAGVEAAKAAGMRAIAVPDPSFDRGLYPQADAVLASLLAFDPVPWGLPTWP